MPAIYRAPLRKAMREGVALDAMDSMDAMDSGRCGRLPVAQTRWLPPVWQTRHPTRATRLSPYVLSAKRGRASGLQGFVLKWAVSIFSA